MSTNNNHVIKWTSQIFCSPSGKFAETINMSEVVNITPNKITLATQNGVLNAMPLNKLKNPPDFIKSKIKAAYSNSNVCHFIIYTDNTVYMAGIYELVGTLY
jgi:hypothetical protein